MATTIVEDKPTTETVPGVAVKSIPHQTKDLSNLNLEDGQSPEQSKPPANPWMDPSSFPDGGFHAWMTVAGASACMFVSWGWINCIGVFQEYYMTGPLKQYSPSTVGWILSLETFFMLALSPIAGLIFDNYGPRYLLLVGSFLHVFGLMMASISTQYYQLLLAQGVCSAIGANLIFTPAVSCVSTWFFKKRGMAIGLSSAGSSLGGIIFPIVVSKMIPQVGFGWAMRTCALIVLALVVFANLTLRSRLPPRPRRLRLMDMARPFREPGFSMTVASAFFFFWGMFPVMSFITSRAISSGMSAEMANYLVAILNAGSVLGRTLPGILGDKVGRYNVMFIFCMFTAVVILAVWIPGTSSAAQIVFAVLFGFGSGSAIGLNPALIAQISPIKEIGARTGAAFSVGAIAALIGTPLGGALITHDHGGYLSVQLFAGITCAAGATMYLIARFVVGGFDFRKKV